MILRGLPSILLGVILGLAGACVRQAGDPLRDSGGDLVPEDASAQDAGVGCSVCPSATACDEPSGLCAREAVTRMEARDGTRLYTRVLLPAVVPPEGAPALLLRTPYRVPGAQGDDLYRELATFMAARGYVFVLQDCRGRFESEGEFLPFHHEISDGQDAVHWIVRQPWSNHRVGTIGGSYEGYTALAAAVDTPEVQVVVADDAARDMRFNRVGGVLRTFALEWLYFLDHEALPGDAVRQALTNSVHPEEGDETTLSRTDPTWQGLLATEDLGSAPEESLETVYDRLCVPVFSVYSSTTLWYDSLRIFEGLRTRGCALHREDQHIVLTPETHVYHMVVLPSLRTPVNQQMLDTLDRWLLDTPNPARVPPVQYYSSGETILHGADALDHASATRTLHLGPGAALLATSPATPADEVLSVDPAIDDPCALTAPYLSYVGAPLTEPLYISGEALVHLDLRSSAPDIDLFASLWDYDPTAVAAPALLSIGTLRARYRDSTSSPTPLPVGQDVLVTVPVPSFTHRLEAGRQLLLLLATSACGWYENPQTGEALSAQTHSQPATLRIHTGGTHDSRVEFPVVDL